MSALLKLLVVTTFIILLVESLPTENSDEENEFSFDKIKRCMGGLDGLGDFKWWHIIFIPFLIIATPFIMIWDSLFG